MITTLFATTLNIQPDTNFVKAINAGSLISSLISIFIIISFIAAFFFLLQGAFQWITSGGDEGKVEAARNRITQAIVGLVIVVAVWALFGLVEDFLGVNVFGGTGITLPTIGGNAQAAPNCTYLNAGACAGDCTSPSTCQTGTTFCSPIDGKVYICKLP